MPQCAARTSSAALVTMSPVLTAPASADSRRSVPGASCAWASGERLEAISLAQPPPEILEGPRARDVRHAVEVVGRRRRGRVPLERVGLPGGVADAGPAAARPDDVHGED